MTARPVALRAIVPSGSRGDSKIYEQVFGIVRGPQDAESCTELHALRVLAELKAETARMTWRAIDDARAAGVSWEVIGQSLGMTRQGAQQTYRRKLDGLSVAEPLVDL